MKTKLASVPKELRAAFQPTSKTAKAMKRSLPSITSPPGADWFITEKDSDPDNTGQHQAFGLADIFQDGGELGYISIPELLANGAELDFHFTPRTLAVVCAKRNAAPCCSTPDPAAVEFNETDCSGVFDGFTVTSDADPGL